MTPRAWPPSGRWAERAPLPVAVGEPSSGAASPPPTTPAPTDCSRPCGQAASATASRPPPTPEPPRSSPRRHGRPRLRRRPRRADPRDPDRRSPAGPVDGEQRILPHMRGVGSAYDEPAYNEPAYDDGGFEDFGEAGTEPERAPRSRRHGSDDPARHAYFPGRRMNLGVVLLPLRIFLGFISIYAGMGKLCDPVYFDGGKRGSMVKWLNTLHPWKSPNRCASSPCTTPSAPVWSSPSSRSSWASSRSSAAGSGSPRWSAPDSPPRSSSPSAGRPSRSTTPPTSSTWPPGRR